MSSPAIVEPTSPEHKDSVIARVSDALGRFAARKTLACIGVALLVLGTRAALLPLMPIPHAEVQDEFSYLLAADTFASGRLTNPQHPMWVHFETMHENQRPTYASKYPPAQGLVLAFGQRFLGHPWWGVWLSMGLLCASICWMLQGYMSPGWAFLGGILTVLQIGITSYWMNSYWGGAVAGIGGALITGALPRLIQAPSMGTALTAVFGVLVLGNSRPYEGGVAVIAACIAFWMWMRRERMSWSHFLKLRVIVPSALMLVGGAAWMGYFNFRVTGSPIILPYTVNNREYASAPHVYVLPAGKPPVYRHAVLRAMWEWEAEVYRSARRDPLRRMALIWGYRIGPKLLPGLWVFAALIAIIAVRSWATRAAVCIFGAVFVAISLETMGYSHYAAPALGAAMILETAGLAWITAKRQSRDRATIVIAFAAAALASGIMAISPPAATLPGRPGIVYQLEHRPGPQLVFVRFSPVHWWEDWVYNRADIDHSKIVWAQDMGERNRELLDYYPDRTAWILDHDSFPPKLIPYSRSSIAANDGDSLPTSPR
jgi:hypothetical protein